MSAPAWDDLVRRFAAARVAVIGDVMLDHFLIGRVDRISPEAPVPIVRFARDEYRLGGAANVAHNARALGASVALAGLAGDDDRAITLRRELHALGIDETGLVADPDRPTTLKLRVVTDRNQQVARVDYEQDAEPRADVAAALQRAAAASLADAGAVIVSDYRKGVVSDALIATVCERARAAGRPVLIDPKIPSAARYRGAMVITPNHHEAELMTGRGIRDAGDAARAARALHDACGASVLMTWGERGMWLFDATGGTAREEAIPAAAREVADVTGAGDTVIATAAVAIAAGASLHDAAHLANVAAGIVVGRFGPATVTQEELRSALARRAHAN